MSKINKKYLLTLFPIEDSKRAKSFIEEAIKKLSKSKKKFDAVFCKEKLIGVFKLWKEIEIIANFIYKNWEDVIIYRTTKGKKKMLFENEKDKNSKFIFDSIKEYYAKNKDLILQK